MKAFKNNSKLIIGFIIGAILASGVTVFATYQYLSTDVEYIENKSVKQALDELYAYKKDISELNTLKANINQTDATAASILKGKKAYTTDGLITGTQGYISGTYNHTANTPFSISFGFTPSKVLIASVDPNSKYIILYDSNIDSNVLEASTNSGGYLRVSPTGFTISNNSIYADLATSGWVKDSFSVTYWAFE